MPLPSSSPPIRHTADPARTREDLASLRPGLVDRYDEELAGARAAVLARLLGALDREHLPEMTARRPGEVVFRGLTVRYDPAAAAPFAAAGAGLSAAVHVARQPPPGDWAWQGPEPGGTAPAGAVLFDPGTLVRVLWPGTDLAAEIDNSVANLALARAGRDLPGSGLPRPGLPQPGDPDALGRLEQLVTDGHPLHPCCRTRGGMSVADVLAYAPEHAPVIRLRRLRVPPDRWWGTAEPVLLAHPWQAGRLLDRYPWLADDGETAPCRPLMSLRTVAPVDGGPHVKTAVDVQMTSAVRTVSPAAVHNGPILSALLRRLTADLPIDVLAETAAGAVLVDGVPQRHLAHVVREAPALGPGETAVPLAALGASPLLLATVPSPYDVIAQLGTLLFAPLLRVLERGVALEAHGQNTLVVLRDGRPTRILYRDFGGVRVLPARLRNAGLEPPGLRGDLPTDDPAVLRTKLAAAAFGTVAAQLIAALTRHRGADPGRLWGLVAAAVRESGTADAPYLLRDPLPVKATTAMRLAADPLDDIWALLDNPMAAHA
ncbi:IucA/IucC family siderophore biosynthesis protein [Paractinoplanes rishiriensis]|uniref:IucA/IucC family siderophore biosynthesis protein n=1 Tax=Paractinoplanes rishiriensis TaxID=1050105 RepID=UPI001EF392C0|nr:IucA/IucC family siderophore biosynthesis protein [Actinoplanes rishiriensis]